MAGAHLRSLSKHGEAERDEAAHDATTTPTLQIAVTSHKNLQEGSPTGTTRGPVHIVVAAVLGDSAGLETKDPLATAT